MLDPDPDPDPDQLNMDPKPCLQVLQAKAGGCHHAAEEVAL
jgi:hypothetical protein